MSEDEGEGEGAGAGVGAKFNNILSVFKRVVHHGRSDIRNDLMIGCDGYWVPRDTFILVEHTPMLADYQRRINKY